ncbi:MAG: HEAT repeat domain-containing protein, partial [candidate division WOR-3 bacterium]|nr:HEAT repeat domain-containing protein [candidate division WOR-3 bacterium]
MLPEEIVKNILAADPKLKFQAIQQLKKLSAQEQVNLLLTLLESEKSEFRQVITNTLLELGRNIAEILIQRLKSSSDYVRSVIVDVLSETLNSTDAITILNYLADENPMVRAAAIEILGRLKDNWSLSYLRSFLKDPTPIVRIKSAQALGNMQDKLSLDALLNLLTDEDNEVKIAAIQALAKIKEARACDSLWQISLSDSDLDVRNN